MQYPLCNLLRPALIEKVSAQVSADPSADVHALLIPIAAIRALPQELSILFHDLDFPVISAHLTLVRFRVQLRIHDVVVDEPHDRQHRRDVFLHVGDFYVTDRASGRKSLKLRLKCKLLESINGLRHMNVVAVGDVVLIRHGSHPQRERDAQD